MYYGGETAFTYEKHCALVTDMYAHTENMLKIMLRCDVEGEILDRTALWFIILISEILIYADSIYKHMFLQEAYNEIIRRDHSKNKIKNLIKTCFIENVWLSTFHFD